MGVVCAMPLGRGLVTTTFSSGKPLAPGSDKDIRDKFMPRFLGENKEQNMAYIKKFKAFADKKNCTVPQLALAWLLKQGDDIIPIPGTKQIKYLEQNIKSLDIRLTDAEEAEIRNFLDSNSVAGPAIPEQLQHLTYRDSKPLLQ